MLKFPKSTLLQSSSFLFRAIFNCTTLLQSRLLMFWSNASKFIFYLISCSLWALETLNDVEEKVRYLLKHSTLKKIIIDVATKKSVNLSEIIFPFKTIFSSPKEPEINESFIYLFFFWGGGESQKAIFSTCPMTLLTWTKQLPRNESTLLLIWI